LENNYLLEGCFSEMKINIKMIESDFDIASKIYLFFPVYYVPAATNFAEDLYCKINSIEIICERNREFP